MKILHVTQGYAPARGGTEWLIQRISEELVRQFGDEVTVFTTNCYNSEGFFKPHLPRLPIGWETINGVRVRRFPVHSRVSQLLRIPQALAYRLNAPGNQYLRALSGGPIIPGLSRAIAEFPADVIAASSFPLLHMFAARRGAQAGHRPCVLIGGLHPQDAWGFQRPMIYHTIQQASRYIAYTEFEADYVVSRGARPDHVAVVGVGVDPEPFQQTSPVEAKQRLGLGEGPVIGFIGQVSAAKGVDTLLEAMPLIWEVFPEAQLLVAGVRTLFAQYMENSFLPPLKSQSHKVSLHYNFPEAEKPWLFAAVDVFAYPSGYESFGIAFLEAWASGKPVIGCRRGAVPCVVQAGQDGLLVDYQDAKMLAEAIIQLLSNRQWARALGEAGRQKVLARYTWPQIARRFRDVYLAALTER